MIRSSHGDVEILTTDLQKTNKWSERWKRRIRQVGSGTKSKDLEDVEKMIWQTMQRCLCFKVQCLCACVCIRLAPCYTHVLFGAFVGKKKNKVVCQGFLWHHKGLSITTKCPDGSIFEYWSKLWPVIVGKHLLYQISVFNLLLMRVCVCARVCGLL